MPVNHASKRVSALVAFLVLGAASAADADGLSTYGTPGIVDMPSATVTGDGTLSWTTSHIAGGHLRNTLHFQISPRLSGTFRYVVLQGYENNGDDRFDRSFDVHYLLREETAHLPAVAVGLRDFGGSGIYGSEYFVASKHFLRNRLTLSAGIGWGRLASHGSFRNPLGLVSDHFLTRPGKSYDINETGRVSFDKFFRGDAAFFGGLDYQINDRLRFALEYSSDSYPLESARMEYDYGTPFNVGLNYRASHRMTVNAFVIGGAQVGLGFTYLIDPRAPRMPGGAERAVPALLPRAEIAALGWSLDDLDANRGRLRGALDRQGLALESYAQEGETARIVLQNGSYRAQPEALGRAAREMANNLPPEIERFEITLTANGMPTSRSTFRRDDLQALEHAWDGSWQSFVRADIADAPDRLPADPGLYPDLDWSLLPYFRSSLFDPDSPIRADFGLAASATYHLAPGLSLDAVIRQKAFGTLDQSTRPSTSILPHVRSDAPLYDKLSGPQVTQLTADYLFRPAGDLYGRLSMGYLEPMFAGLSSEILWYPQGSRLALGADLNYVAQRDPYSRLGLTDYRIATGHASAYYDFGNSYRGQVDVGRYLAGDWGSTVTLAREFDNGFKIGAFFTLTDVPFDDFGEGSFDKGISFSIPLTWISGDPSRRGFAQTIRPIQRDGGAQLSVAHRLYEEVRGANASELEHHWGKFWR